MGGILGQSFMFSAPDTKKSRFVWEQYFMGAGGGSVYNRSHKTLCFLNLLTPIQTLKLTVLSYSISMSMC